MPSSVVVFSTRVSKQIFFCFVSCFEVTSRDPNPVVFLIARKLSECALRKRGSLLPWEFHRRDNTCFPLLFEAVFFSPEMPPSVLLPPPRLLAKEVSSTVSFFIKFAVRRFSSHKRPSNSGVGRKLVGRWRGGGGERGRGDGGAFPPP